MTLEMKILLGMALVVLGILIIATCWAIAHHKDKERKDEMRSWAQARGYSFRSSADPATIERVRSVFGIDADAICFARNTCSVQLAVLDRSVPCTVGDFRFTMIAGQSSTEYQCTYALVTLPFGVPEFCIRPEFSFDRIAGAMGFGDIDFEDISFSDRYHVASKSRRFVYNLLDPRMIEFLNSASPRPTLLASGKDLVLRAEYDPAKRLDLRWNPGQCDEQVESLRAFFDRWPDHLVTQLDAESGTSSQVTTEESHA